MSKAPNRRRKAVPPEYKVWAVVVVLLLVVAVGGHWALAQDENAGTGQADLARVGDESPAVGEQEAAPPANPIRRVAQKALRGDFGKLKPWQHKAYKYALAQDVTVSGRAWVTTYGPWAGFARGEGCAYGYGCSESTAAANAIPGHYYVLVELPKGWEVRRIEDRGAAWNDRIARRKGTELWIDRWVVKRDATRICRYATIRAYKTW